MPTAQIANVRYNNRLWRFRRGVRACVKITGVAPEEHLPGNEELPVSASKYVTNGFGVYLYDVDGGAAGSD